MLPKPPHLLQPTVVLDLDDTLFDHANTARAALAATVAGLPAFRDVNPEALYQHYRQLLEELHSQMMAGRHTAEEARRLRFQRLLAPYGEELAATTSEHFAAQYYAHYQRLRQPMAGAAALLKALN